MDRTLVPPFAPLVLPPPPPPAAAAFSATAPEKAAFPPAQSVGALSCANDYQDDLQVDLNAFVVNNLDQSHLGARSEFVEQALLNLMPVVVVQPSPAIVQHQRLCKARSSSAAPTKKRTLSTTKKSPELNTRPTKHQRNAPKDGGDNDGDNGGDNGGDDYGSSDDSSDVDIDSEADPIEDYLSSDGEDRTEDEDEVEDEDEAEDEDEDEIEDEDEVEDEDEDEDEEEGASATASAKSRRLPASAASTGSASASAEGSSSSGKQTCVDDAVAAASALAVDDGLVAWVPGVKDLAWKAALDKHCADEAKASKSEKAVVRRIVGWATAFSKSMFYFLRVAYTDPHTQGISQTATKVTGYDDPGVRFVIAAEAKVFEWFAELHKRVSYETLRAVARNSSVHGDLSRGIFKQNREREMHLQQTFVAGFAKQTSSVFGRNDTFAMAMAIELPNRSGQYIIRSALWRACTRLVRLAARVAGRISQHFLIADALKGVEGDSPWNQVEHVFAKTAGAGNAKETIEIFTHKLTVTLVVQNQFLSTGSMLRTTKAHSPRDDSNPLWLKWRFSRYAQFVANGMLRDYMTVCATRGDTSFVTVIAKFLVHGFALRKSKTWIYNCSLTPQKMHFEGETKEVEAQWKQLKANPKAKPKARS